MSRRGRSRRGQRDASSPSLAELLAPVLPTPALSAVHLLDGLTTLGEVQDGRRFDPALRPDLRREKSTLGAGIKPLRAAKSKVATRGRWPGVVRGVAFDEPERVVRCVRRKERREVIFAMNKRKKGAGASRRRRNFWSDVQC